MLYNKRKYNFTVNEIFNVTRITKANMTTYKLLAYV